jgi:succinyl-CoA synthetase beta subunit
MKLHEYAAKKIFNEYGIPTPQSIDVDTPQEAVEAVRKFGKPVAVKSQVLVGGRGKAGGIKFAETPQEAYEVAEELLGMDIKGETVEKLLIEEKINIKSEFYLSVAVDRSSRKPLIMASLEGGVDIEEVARETPEKIYKYHIQPSEEFFPFQARDIARKMGIDPTLIPVMGSFIWKLFKVFKETDANIAEINPLVLTVDGLLAADAKLDVDDDAVYRQKRFSDQKQKKDEFAYVKLDGDIAVIGNGAGLTLTGMDMVNLYGGQPATFLDIGGGASQENIARALKLVISYPRVKVVFLNVLGGITRADDVARGILEVSDKVDRTVPMVIRLTGTNEEEGQKILMDAGISYEISMEKAAKKAVEICQNL